MTGQRLTVDDVLTTTKSDDVDFHAKQTQDPWPEAQVNVMEMNNLEPGTRNLELFPQSSHYRRWDKLRHILVVATEFADDG
jgi:hypothetical protein